mmetsp:Transcript_66538/g.184227  ORF Transcript_66538/g.184227 Transcript_66538/m.184227 type:complete len:285 (+) Transcript_66538:213-1067(+)
MQLGGLADGLLCLGDAGLLLALPPHRLLARRAAVVHGGATLHGHAADFHPGAQECTHDPRRDLPGALAAALPGGRALLPQPTPHQLGHGGRRGLHGHGHVPLRLADAQDGDQERPVGGPQHPLRRGRPIAAAPHVGQGPAPCGHLQDRRHPAEQPPGPGPDPHGGLVEGRARPGLGRGGGAQPPRGVLGGGQLRRGRGHQLLRNLGAEPDHRDELPGARERQQVCHHFPGGPPHADQGAAPCADRRRLHHDPRGRGLRPGSGADRGGAGQGGPQREGRGGACGC